nr:uncharacterized protein LOC109778467 isoform X2 [Aegilops tauschii subsp. strangulata]
MAAAGDPLQGQARPGQACWPPSRVTASAVTTTASSSPETAAPLKADLRHVFRMHARVRPGQAAGAAGGGGFLQWPRNRGLHLQQGQAEWQCRAKLAVCGTPEKPLIGLYQEWTHTVQDIPDCRGRTGGTATSDGMKPGHGNPSQPSRP